MYLDIGGDVILHWEDIIVIIDSKPWKSSPPNNTFLRNAMEHGQVNDISLGEPKSYVITEGKVYISPISTVTLKRRIAFIS